MKGTKKEAGHILDAADISYFSTFSERTGYVRGLKSSGVRGCEARGEGTRGARDDMSSGLHGPAQSPRARVARP